MGFVLVNHNTADKLGLIHVSACLLLNLYVINVDYHLGALFFRNCHHSINHDFAEKILSVFSPLACHGGRGYLLESFNIANRYLLAKAFKNIPGLICSHPISLGNNGWMDLLLDKSLRSFEKLAADNNRSCGSIANLVFLGLGNLNHHLGRRMLDIHLLKNRHTIIGDNDVTKAVHKHFVHSPGSEGALHSFSDNLRCENVCALRVSTAPPLSPFLQYQYRLSAQLR